MHIVNFNGVNQSFTQSKCIKLAHYYSMCFRGINRINLMYEIVKCAQFQFFRNKHCEWLEDTLQCVDHDSPAMSLGLPRSTHWLSPPCSLVYCKLHYLGYCREEMKGQSNARAVLPWYKKGLLFIPTILVAL